MMHFSSNEIFMETEPRRVEYYEKRFGIIAVQKAFISPDELVEAFRTQVYEDMGGMRHRLTGCILLHEEAISQEQIDEILIEMFQREPEDHSSET